MAPALANAKGGPRITPRAEGALVQTLDRQRVAGCLRQDGEGRLAHWPSRLAFGPIPVQSAGGAYTRKRLNEAPKEQHYGTSGRRRLAAGRIAHQRRPFHPADHAL